MFRVLIEPAELLPKLGQPHLTVVDVGDESTFTRHHVPGAVHLDYESLIDMKPPATGLLPGPDRLENLFSNLGMSTGSHIVAYDDERNSLACRLLWTLDAVGHRRFSLLNGGLRAWIADGYPVESGPPSPCRGRFPVAGVTTALADKAYVLAHLGSPDVVILDTRSPQEFTGTDVRAARGGHIPGAVNMDWTLAIDPEREPRLKPADDLRNMLQRLGITPDREVIVYCQTHHRSSHTYVMLKSLGFPRVRGYHGSWSEWGNDSDLPVETD